VNTGEITPVEQALVKALIAAVVRELRTGTEQRPDERLDPAAGRNVRDDDGPYADYHGT
jgi:hypothetical protein